MLALRWEGKSAGHLRSEFDPAQIAVGTRVEMEHTHDPTIAERIAMDHLVEDRDYYRKLATIHLDGVTGFPIWARWVGGVALIGLAAFALRRKRR